MKWRGRGQSTNVEDRRGRGIGGIGIAGGGIGLVIVIIMTFLGGGNSDDILSNIQGTNTAGNAPYQETEQEKELANFVSVVLADTEVVWSELFNEKGMEYTKPTMVLYNDQVQSACGTAGSAVGPFYCPGDYKLYIDLSFYEELNNKFQAPGDFAMAYVIAHEVGHHVQTLLGTNEKVMSLRNQMSEAEFNQYLIRLELQADYYAGVFAHYAEGQGYLDVGDIKEAITAASAVGDDNIQKKSQGYVVPESFTHGTSEQRVRWFKKGYENGTIKDGDTFNANQL